MSACERCGGTDQTQFGGVVFYHGALQNDPWMHVACLADAMHEQERDEPRGDDDEEIEP